MEDVRYEGWMIDYRLGMGTAFGGYNGRACEQEGS